MIKITNDEAEYLRGKGWGNFVRKTYTKHPTYYMVEMPKVISELKRYQNNKKVR